MKRIRTLLAAALATIALCVLLPAAAFAADEVPDSPTTYTCGNPSYSLKWSFDESTGTLRVYEPSDHAIQNGNYDGKMGNWNIESGSANAETQFPYADKVKHVIIDEGVKSITNLGGMTNCTSVSLPNTLTYIAASTFSGDSSLVSIDLPLSVKTTGGSVFQGCDSLQKVTAGCCLNGRLNSIFLGTTQDVELIPVHSLEAVDFQPTSVGDTTAENVAGHYAGVHCKNGCKTWYTDLTGQTEAAEPKIPRVGKVFLTTPDDGELTIGTRENLLSYTGQAIKPTIQVCTSSIDGEITTIDPKYYDVTYPADLQEAGKHDVTITFKGLYTGEKHFTLHVTYNLANATIEYGDNVTIGEDGLPTFIYGGKSPSFVEILVKSVKDKSGATISPDQYTLRSTRSQASDTDPAILYVRPADDSDAAGKLDVSFMVKKLNVTDPSLVSFTPFDRPLRCDPEISSDDPDFPKPAVDATVIHTGYKLIADGSDEMELFVQYYKVDDLNAYAFIMVADSINMNGNTALYYKLAKLEDVKDCQISLSETNFACTGKPCQPQVKIPVPGHEGTFYQEGVDYTVTYKNNVNPGTATAVITAIEGDGKTNLLTGSTEVNFNIGKVDLSQTNVSIANCTFTGKPCQPQVKIPIPGRAGEFYKQGVDYTVKYENNVNAGTGAVIITAIENESSEDNIFALTGSVKKSFAIQKMQISKCSITAKDLVYTGSKLTPAVTVTAPNGFAFSSTNFTVGKTSSANVGKCSVVVTGKGNLTGSKTIAVTILPKATKIKKLSALSKGFKATWAKAGSAYCTGYQIRYSAKKSMARAKTVAVSKRSTASKKVLKLKAGKAYYMQIRTYKKVGATKYYSAWSTAKKVTTKK